MNEFPWAALLELRSSDTNRTNRCGGSLISNKHILTAGHCLRETASNGEISDVYDDITVVLGETELIIFCKNILKYFPGDHDLTEETETIKFQSKALRTELDVHPKFFLSRSLGVINYDVGLLTLQTPVDFTNKRFSHIR